MTMTAYGPDVEVAADMSCGWRSKMNIISQEIDCGGWTVRLSHCSDDAWYTEVKQLTGPGRLGTDWIPAVGPLSRSRNAAIDVARRMIKDFDGALEAHHRSRWISPRERKFWDEVMAYAARPNT